MPRTINITKDDPEKTCPKCGSEVEWGPDCPGFHQDGKVMVCQGCGNADYWE